MGPGRMGSGQLAPEQSGSGRMATGQLAPEQTGSGRMGPGQFSTGRNRTKPMSSEPLLSTAGILFERILGQT